jgi:hypothetical protein
MHGINNGENLDFLSEEPSNVLRVPKISKIRFCAPRGFGNE